METFHDWYQKGIINPDAATLTEGRVYNMWRIAQGWESAGVTSWGPQMGKDVVVARVGDTILSNETVRGSINMVSTNSKYPEKCLQLLNLVNTDTTLRDMFHYGEEGVNFECVDVDGKQMVHKITEDWTMAGYTRASFFTVTPVETDTNDQWGEILGTVYSFGVQIGASYSAKNIPHVPYEQGNREMYPIGLSGTTLVRDILYRYLLPASGICERGIETGVFENGMIIVNHRPVPYMLPHKYRTELYQYPFHAAHEGRGILGAHEAVWVSEDEADK